MLNRTIFAMLLIVAAAFPCFAQDSKPPESKQNDVVAFERDLEAASARGDLVFLERGLADDLTFTHGDAWRTGGPARVDTKNSLMNLFARDPFVSRQVNAQRVELHGAIAITTGRIDVKLKAPFLNGGKTEYSVWFVRVYRAKEGGWELVSHRTVAEQ